MYIISKISTSFMTINSINSFQNIHFPNHKRPLVICDIDFTFLRSKSSYDFYHQLFKQNLYMNQQLEQYIQYFLNKDIQDSYICQTDCVGFQQMIQIIHLLNGRFIFLTARHKNTHAKTLYDLSKVGLVNPIHFEIHYTNNVVQKGDYIKSKIVKQINEYNHFIFIDDCVETIQYASYIMPYFCCYIFKCD